MVRRTKTEAQATRASILDAAESLFQQRGVSRTSLQDIAQAAGVTRGAVYWHFKDKSDLFNAMMERVHAPLLAPDGPDGRGRDPLQRLRQDLLHKLERVAGDAQVRRVFEIATQKVEYVDDLMAVRQRHQLAVREHRATLAGTLRAAGLPRAAAARHALALHALVVGLLHVWLLEPGAFDLVASGRHALDTYLRGLADSLPARA